MSILIYRTFYVFFNVIEIILFVYIISSWFPIPNGIKKIILTLINPFLDPIRFLLKRSIFNTSVSDFSPIIGIVILSFLQHMMSQLMGIS
jgi:uncharacterized protein YggT (Ycf19 family)